MLKLTHELSGWQDVDAARWQRNLQPLVRVIESLYLGWLPKQTHPIRSGMHGNTAFGLSFALDHAEATGHTSLRNLIRQRSHDYFAGDRDYPAAWEPSGSDFLSPCLCEADLMRRVLSPAEFDAWLARFLPELPVSLLTPATVTDRRDGQLVHLDGLNLSRAWCLFNLAHALPTEDERRPTFLSIAERHLEAGLAGVIAAITSGEYAGEHWLATFAVYALACAAQI